jgi:hypothetical protein
MAKTSIVEEICESCDEETAVKKHRDLGWVCKECLDNYKNMEDDETVVKELSDTEIDELVDLDEKDEDEDEDELSMDEKELSRVGFSLDKDSDNDYN